MKFLLTKQIPCGRYEVANCTRCDPDPEKERCIECKSGMFPFVAGTECYPCDHEKYGQVGCEGNCDSSKYSTIKNVLCDKCKEEYYNVEDFVLIVQIVLHIASNVLMKLLQEVTKKYLNVLNALIILIGYLILMENVVLVFYHPIV
jgi:hypothetical protein